MSLYYVVNKICRISVCNMHRLWQHRCVVVILCTSKYESVKTNQNSAWLYTPAMRLFVLIKGRELLRYQGESFYVPCTLITTPSPDHQSAIVSVCSSRWHDQAALFSTYFQSKIPDDQTTHISFVNVYSSRLVRSPSSDSFRCPRNTWGVTLSSAQ